MEVNMSLPNTNPKTWNIYFVRGTESGKIMIAKTTREPDVVIKGLKIPEQCVLIKSILGTQKLREQLHEEFSSLAIPDSTNWYKPHPDIIARIDSIEDYDGDKPPPPPRPYNPREYEDPYFYCSMCNSQEEDENGLLQLEDDYSDWGSVHIYMGHRGTGYLCRECAFQGGLTNSVFRHFLKHRVKLDPFWNEADESFLSMCSDEGEIDEKIRFAWIKCRVFVRNMLGNIIVENPNIDLNSIRSSIIKRFDNWSEEKRIFKNN